MSSGAISASWATGASSPDTAPFSGHNVPYRHPNKSRPGMRKKMEMIEVEKILHFCKANISTCGIWYLTFGHSNPGKFDGAMVVCGTNVSWLDT